MVLCWPGGKWKLKGIIVQELLRAFNKNPKIKIYCETFLGGASVFYKLYEEANEKFEKFVLNDINSELMLIYKALKNNSLKCNHIPNTCLRDLYDSFKNIVSSGEKDPCKIAYIIKCSFGCKPLQVASFSNKKGKPINFIEKLSDAFRDNRVILLNEDYKNVFKKFDSKETLFYLDPPYFNRNSKELYGVDFNHFEFFENVKKLKGLWLMSNSIEAAKFFKDFNIKKVNTKYSMNNIVWGTNIEVEEVLISNY